MIGVLVQNSALLGYTGLGTTWANEMNVMKHAPSAGLTLEEEQWVDSSNINWFSLLEKFIIRSITLVEDKVFRMYIIIKQHFDGGFRTN